MVASLIRILSHLTSVYRSVYSQVMMLTITIDRGLEEPVYAQVAHQLRRLIASGALLPGKTLPSVRRLAGDLGVNLNTIARAYRLLEDEGFLVIRGRSGAKVAPPAEEVEGPVQTKLLEEMRATFARLRQAGVTSEEISGIVQQEVQALKDREMESSDE
jgi:DNA-binding transcriptional regulator YhcF (GntR family)